MTVTTRVEQEAQLLQRDRAMLRVIEYFVILPMIPSKTMNNHCRRFRDFLC